MNCTVIPTQALRHWMSAFAAAGVAATATALLIGFASDASAGATARPRPGRHAEPGPGVPTFADAVDAFRAQRWAEAYGRFATLADHGDAGAATMALAMVSAGSDVFGKSWAATPGQLRRWSELAAHRATDDAQLLRAEPSE